MSDVEFTVFTKPWKMPIAELGAFVSNLGFDGLELPVRPGYPVNPDNVASELPRAAKTLADYGLKIRSVAGPMDERTIAACAEAGVPVIRVCINIPPDTCYMEHEAAAQREFDELLPALDEHSVKIGVQNHYGRSVANAMGIRHLIEKYDPKHIGAVWDPAHCALAGEIPELALDILRPHLCIVNLKNAVWQRTNGPEAEVAEHKHYWTTGRQGLCSWAKVVEELRARDYSGNVCLTAEYSDKSAVNRLIAQDLSFAKSLFEGH